jgi:hypothetical protein
MRRIAIAIAAVAAAGILATAAQADVLAGQSGRQGNQCFNFTSPDHVRDSRYGTWGACPKPAAAPVVHVRRHSSR